MLSLANIERVPPAVLRHESAFQKRHCAIGFSHLEALVDSPDERQESRSSPMSESLSPNRLEAFSDGVIAVIITIMVLELKVPSTHAMTNQQALESDLPLLLVYLLSFVQTGIYWVNHHYLVDNVEYVTHGMLWANLAFLFCLSLIPFATNWVGERGVNGFSVALYAIVCALPAVAWIVLSHTIFRTNGKPLASGPLKQGVSSVLYLGAIPVAQYSPRMAIGMICFVAVLWLIPPRSVVEKTRARKVSAEPPHSDSR